MEELTGSGEKTISKKPFEELRRKTLIKEYENPSSPAFGKNAQTVQRNLLRKYAKFRGYLTNKLSRNILEQSSTTYSITRKPCKNKYFHGTSFYSTHKHYRWHVDLQDMTIFRKAARLKKKMPIISYLCLSTTLATILW